MEDLLSHAGKYISTKIDEQSEDSWHVQSDLKTKIDSTKIDEQIKSRKIDWLDFDLLLITLLIYYNIKLYAYY